MYQTRRDIRILRNVAAVMSAIALLCAWASLEHYVLFIIFVGMNCMFAGMAIGLEFAIEKLRKF